MSRNNQWSAYLALTSGKETSGQSIYLFSQSVLIAGAVFLLEMIWYYQYGISANAYYIDPKIILISFN